MQSDSLNAVLRHLLMATGLAVTLLDRNGRPAVRYGPASAAPPCAECENRPASAACVLPEAGSQEGTLLCRRGCAFHICPVGAADRRDGLLVLGPQPAGDPERLACMRTMLRACASLIRAERLYPAPAGVFAELTAYVREHLSDPLDFRTLSSVFFLSPDTLSRVTRRESGLPLRRYIQAIRLEEARALLLNTRLSVQEITGRCGFADHNYFSRAFRKRYGSSPTGLRRASGAGQENGGR